MVGGASIEQKSTCACLLSVGTGTDLTEVLRGLGRRFEQVKGDSAAFTVLSSTNAEVLVAARVNTFRQCD